MPNGELVPTKYSYQTVRRTLYLTLGLLLVFICVAIGWYAYVQYKHVSLTKNKEHLISGVPYAGSYLGTEINSGAASSVYSLLQYWGDTKFNARDIARAFPYSPFKMVRGTEKITYGDIYEFLSSNEYNIAIPEFKTKGDVQLFIDQDIPVIIGQRLTDEIEEDIQTMRLIIGYSDKTGEFITHDNNFGNNYRISYDEFFRLLNPGSNYLLIATPNARSRRQLNGPNTNYEYPQRLSIMDSEGVRRIQISWTLIDTLMLQNPPDYERVASIWESILSDSGFKELHPAGRYQASFQLGRIHTNFLNKHEDAIRIFEDVTIPLLSYDFSKAFGEWQRNNPGVYDNPWWRTAPWVGIGVANIRLANQATNTSKKEVYLKEARVAFTEVLKKDPTDQDAKDFFAGDYEFAKTP